MLWSDEELVPRPEPTAEPEPEPSLNLPSGDPTPSRLPSGADNSFCPAVETLPVPVECTDQDSAPSVTDVKPFPTSASVPGPALVPVPEHALDLPSEGLTTCEPLAPIMNSSSSPKSSKGKTLVDKSLRAKLVVQIQELQQQLAEIHGTALTLVVAAAEIGGTPSDPIVGTTTVEIVAAAKAVASIVPAPPIEAASNGTYGLGPEGTPVPPQVSTPPIISEISKPKGELEEAKPPVDPGIIRTVDPEEKIRAEVHRSLEEIQCFPVEVTGRLPVSRG
ncbi:serine/threonine-protein kinase WNK1-like [Macrobrachium rosenbergii]|uniref:serine/threonine-protein kinase WNK1-like n=1 Tax=Macrobrachium rosenbergii TaxID=79674 RepID=UPI0034D6E4DF